MTRKTRNITPRERSALEAYSDLVAAHAGRLGLVSAGDVGRFFDRHVRDSLRLLPHVLEAPPGAATDLGSGAGVPGIPLAVCTPDRIWRLIEPRRRRAAFLEECVRRLGLENVEVVTATAEDAARRPELARAHAVATARALAPPASAVELARPLVAPGGRIVVLVGERAELPPEAALVEPGIAMVRA